MYNWYVNLRASSLGKNKLLVIIIKKKGKKAQMHKMRNGDGETEIQKMWKESYKIYLLCSTQLNLQTWIKCIIYRKVKITKNNPLERCKK